jgi:transcriptional regulator with XRE-family HTH domain
MIHKVSQNRLSCQYPLNHTGFAPLRTIEAVKEWKTWGSRFRQQCRDKGLNLAKIAERLDLAESTVRSWTNGTRKINLSDFFRLCGAAGIEPSEVLFAEADQNQPLPDAEKFLAMTEAWRYASPEWKEMLLTTADAIIQQHRATRSRRAPPAQAKRI